MTKIKYLSFFLLIFCACKIEIESPYEDAEGITVDYLETHDVHGDKFIFLGDTVITYNNSYWSFINFYDIRLTDEDLAEYYFDNMINDLTLFDKYVITATSDSMIYALNFDNLENIYIADSLKLESQSLSLIVKDSYVYVLGTNKIFVIDGSDINNLNVIKTISFSDELTNFIDYEEKLYVAAGEKCFIFDIKHPANPNPTDSILFDSYSDRLNVNKNYLYWLSWGIHVYNLNNKKLEWSLYLPGELHNILIFGEFGIAITEWREAYLINLEFPSKPAAFEMVESNCNYGIIREDKIYLLGDDLKVFLIKKTD